MSRSLQIVRRYAKSLLDVAGQEDGVAAVRADLAEVRRWLAEAPAFHVFAACDRFGGREIRLRALLELARAAELGRLTAEFLARIEAAQQGHQRIRFRSFRPLAGDQHRAQQIAVHAGTDRRPIETAPPVAAIDVPIRKLLRCDWLAPSTLLNAP